MVDHISTPRTSARYRAFVNSTNPEWNKLRFACYARDGFACTICKKSAFNDGIRPEADHRFYRWPIEATKLEDLRTLCTDCHYLETALRQWMRLGATKRQASLLTVLHGKPEGHDIQAHLADARVSEELWALRRTHDCLPSCDNCSWKNYLRDRHRSRVAFSKLTPEERESSRQEWFDETRRLLIDLFSRENDMVLT